MLRKIITKRGVKVVNIVLTENPKRITLRALQYRMLTNMGITLERVKYSNPLGTMWIKTMLTQATKIKRRTTRISKFDHHVTYRGTITHKISVKVVLSPVF